MYWAMSTNLPLQPFVKGTTVREEEIALNGLIRNDILKTIPRGIAEWSNYHLENRQSATQDTVGR